VYKNHINSHDTERISELKASSTLGCITCRRERGITSSCQCCHTTNHCQFSST